MKKIICIATLSAVLSACGGGGGGDNSISNGNSAPPVATQQLAGYLGTWVGGCDGHAQDAATLTRVSDDTIKIAAKTDYYAASGCTGSIVGTQTQTADVTAKYVSTVSASVVLPPSTAANLIKVDTVSASVADNSLVVTGPGVTRVVTAGKAQWCMNFNGGDSTCIHDDGVQKGGTSAGALYLQDNYMYVLDPSGTSYSVNQRYTRK
jgi:hypothetical protein